MVVEIPESVHHYQWTERLEDGQWKIVCSTPKGLGVKDICFDQVGDDRWELRTAPTDENNRGVLLHVCALPPGASGSVSKVKFRERTRQLHVYVLSLGCAGSTPAPPAAVQGAAPPPTSTPLQQDDRPSDSECQATPKEQTEPVTSPVRPTAELVQPRRTSPVINQDRSSSRARPGQSQTTKAELTAEKPDLSASPPSASKGQVTNQSNVDMSTARGSEEISEPSTKMAQPKGVKVENLKASTNREQVPESAAPGLKKPESPKNQIHQTCDPLALKMINCLSELGLAVKEGDTEAFGRKTVTMPAGAGDWSGHKGAAPALWGALTSKGWAVCDDFLSGAEVQHLKRDLSTLDSRLKPAKIGYNQGVPMAQTRGDHMTFLDQGDVKRLPAVATLLTRMEKVVLQPHDSQPPYLQALGGHTPPMYAVYPGRGAKYIPHVDNTNEDGRRVTCILYLNDNWQPQVGGQLRIHCSQSKLMSFALGRPLLPASPSGGQSRAAGVQAVDVSPVAGRLVLFVSDAVVHEVLGSQAPRSAFSTWFTDTAEKARFDSGAVGQSAAISALSHLPAFLRWLAGPPPKSSLQVARALKQLEPRVATLLAQVMNCDSVTELTNDIMRMSPEGLRNLQQQIALSEGAK